ncbi:MAG: hypothetical protein M3Z32_12240 [Acidobacteriota bacterium]|nr:hypothetical protein [Acidobacteriota bacterium]
MSLHPQLPFLVARLVILLAFCPSLWTQTIEFEQNGLRYKTLTKNGVTIMFAPLPSHVREFSIVQVAVSNGSKIAWTVKPEDFTYQRDDGSTAQASPALQVVNSLIEKASRHDVIKLVSTYEAGLYGNTRLQSTNGYEVRRRNALAEVTSARLKAAAAASAIAMVSTRLSPGESTDGAVFFANSGKPLGPGKLRVHAAGENFEFKSEPELVLR